MKFKFALIFLAFPLLALAQNPVGASSSGRANEVATNSAKPVIEYVNVAKDGARVLVTAGQIKSSNSSFAQKVTSNAIADFGELELSRANFKITKNQSNAKFTIKFDILKADPLAKASEGFSGGAIGGMLGGIGGRVLGSVQTTDKAEVWNIAMRWQAIDPSGDQLASGMVEDRMELGAKGTSVMGVSSGASGGATMDTMIQYLVQKAVAEIDMKMK
jgi:hypothetical protein